MMHELHRSESILLISPPPREYEYLATGFSIVILATTPLSIAMVSLGLMYKKECPLDDRIPRYLLFGGIAGLTIVLLRLSLIVSFRNLDSTKEHTAHAGLNMTRSVMYLFILFILIWNLYGSYLLFSSSPEMEDTTSKQYCRPAVIKFSYVWFTIFDIATISAILLWLVSLGAACIHPDFLIIRGIRPPSFLLRKYSDYSESPCLKDPEVGENVSSSGGNKKTFVVDQMAEDSPRQYTQKPSSEGSKSTSSTVNKKIQRRMSNNRAAESRRGSCVSTVIITSPHRPNESASESKKVFNLSAVNDESLRGE